MHLSAVVLLLLSHPNLLQLTSSMQTWIQQPQYLEANPGSTVTLSCLVEDKRGDCRWERNSLPVGAYPGKYEWAGDRASGDCSLRINEASIEYDSGEWVCQVTASSFMAKDTLMSSPAKLIVRDPPKSVQLLSGSSKEAILGAISAPEGEEQRIQCLGVGGSPPPQLKWYLGDRELDNAHRAINSAGNVVSTVNLRMSRRDHGKALRCSAVHPALTTIVDVKSFLDVQYAPIVDITSADALTDLTEGSSVRLRCAADANPVASIVWTREVGGSVLSHGGDLVLPHLTVETAGKYYCQANNSLGVSQPKHVDVKVKYAPIIDEIGPNPNIRQLWGTKLVLTCVARGNPAPQYTWIQYTHSGVEVRGEGRDLVLDRLIYSDEGKYECRAKNSISGHHYETKSKSIKVDVYGSPKVEQPVSEVYVHRGSRGVVDVNFCADPLPKQIWHIDSNPGQKILIHAGTSHEGYSVLTASKSSRPNCYTSTLEIDRVTDKHRSEYVVHFENEHGREIHTVRVKIGAFLGKETLIGGLIGGGMTLVIVLLLLVCCCTKYARNSKSRKHDQESPSNHVEKWSTGSSVSSSSEISTETQQTNQSAGAGSTSGAQPTNQNVGNGATNSRPGSVRANSTSSTGTSTVPSLHNTSQGSMLSNGTRHSALSMSTHQTLVSPPPVSPAYTVFKQFSPDIIQNHCERKNVSFSDDLSVSQECLKTAEAIINNMTAATKQPPQQPPALVSGPAVNYNDLCFPKTSNYGSMRKQGRCDFLTRSNIKRIDDVLREHEQEIRSYAGSRASVRSSQAGSLRINSQPSNRASVRGVCGERRNYQTNSEYHYA